MKTDMNDLLCAPMVTDDGDSVYIGVVDGDIAKIVELFDGRVQADLDAAGNLLGVEVIRGSGVAEAV